VSGWLKLLLTLNLKENTSKFYSFSSEQCLFNNEKKEKIKEEKKELSNWLLKELVHV
jgi:hypothetical protein